MATRRHAESALRHYGRRTRTSKAASLAGPRARETHKTARGFELLVFLTHALELEAEKVARYGGQAPSCIGTREMNGAGAQQRQIAPRDLPQDMPQRGRGATRAAAANRPTDQTTKELIELRFIRDFEQFRGELKLLGLAKGAVLHAFEIDGLLCWVLHNAISVVVRSLERGLSSDPVDTRPHFACTVPRAFLWRRLLCGEGRFGFATLLPEIAEASFRISAHPFGCERHLWETLPKRCSGSGAESPRSFVQA